LVENFFPALRNKCEDKSFWFGAPREDILKNEYLQLVKWLFLYTVWESKLNYRTPSWTSFRIELEWLIISVEKISPLIRLKKQLLITALRRYRPDE